MVYRWLILGVYIIRSMIKLPIKWRNIYATRWQCPATRIGLGALTSLSCSVHKEQSKSSKWWLLLKLLKKTNGCQ